MLRLYGHRASPYTQRVLVFLEELAAAYEFRPVAFEISQHHRQGPFKAIAPYGRVPVMDWNGFILAESNAILRYLAGRLGDGSWYPINLEERALVDQWMDYAGFQVGTPLSKLAWQSFWLPSFGLKTDPQAAEDALAKVHRDLPLIDEHLTRNRYLAGQRISLADLSFLPMLQCAILAKLSLRPYPQLEAWYQTMKQRPAWGVIAVEQSA